MRKFHACVLFLTTAVVASISTTAFAIPMPETLCRSDETPVFSCAIKGKTASLCATRPDSSTGLKLQYRVGMRGGVLDFVYPRSESAASKAFSFASLISPQVFIISFDAGGSSFDLMVGYDNSRFPVSEYLSAGVSTTTSDYSTNFDSCEPGKTVMNAKLLDDAGLVPKSIRVNGFPESPDAVGQALVNGPQLLVRRTIAHGPKWTSTLAYPVIGDQEVDQQISEFITDCIGDDDASQEEPDGNCVREVSSETVRNGQFLVVTLQSYEYETGSAHGHGEASVRVFEQKRGGWAPVAASALISGSQACRRRVGSLLYRRVWQQLAQSYRNGSDSDFQEELITSAEMGLTDDGVVFSYAQYQFGSYIPPQPVLLSYKVLGACFAPRLHASIARPGRVQTANMRLDAH